jgi:hypothetical protein
MRTPRQYFYDALLRTLTKPRRNYRRYGRNDPERLKKHIQKADVILVDGDQRVSQAIKTLTTSPWSHNAVYVGDELLHRDHAAADDLMSRYGPEAAHLVIEASVEEGVRVSPLVKYLDFNIRICRPFGLRARDRQAVLDDLISQIGNRYDVKNIVDLARYLLPFHLVPARLREDALHLGSGVATETICSSMTAAAFQKVGFPILPDYAEPPPRSPVEKALARVLGRPNPKAFTGLFRARHPTLVVPRDFDLSPYFEIVKFNVIEEGDFDYKKMRWTPTWTFPKATEKVLEKRRALPPSNG